MVAMKVRQPEFHFQNPPGWKERTSGTKVVLELAHVSHSCPTLPYTQVPQLPPPCTLGCMCRKTHIQ